MKTTREEKTSVELLEHVSAGVQVEPLSGESKDEDGHDVVVDIEHALHRPGQTIHIGMKR